MSVKTSLPKSATRRNFLATLPAIPIAASAGIGLLQRREGYDFRPVSETIRNAIAVGQATGVAAAAVHRGRIIWEEGFGWANRETGLKVTAHTPFSLASLSKPFTTAAFATLVEEGRLSLDEPANAYLGHARLRGPNADSATIRQLGAHAAGLPSLFEMYTVGGGIAAPSAAAVLKNYGILAYPPARVYEYSNVGYEALGAIASKLTGMEFGTFLTRRLLAPLGMRDSFFDTDAMRLARAATRYDELDRSIGYYTTATPPSGELYASARDLAVFAMFNLGNSLRGGRSILRQRWIAELHKPVLRGPGYGSTTFGWFAGREKSGLTVLFKDGGQPGVSTIMYLVPSENLACLLLTNRSDNGELAQSLVDQMMATVLPRWTTPDTRMAPSESGFSASAEWAGRWSGRLSGGGYDTKVELLVGRKGSATLSLSNGGATKVSPLGIEGRALVARTSGAIAAPDAIRNLTNALSFKLLRDGDSLRGRILASESAPGKLATIPFIVELHRR